MPGQIGRHAGSACDDETSGASRTDDLFQVQTFGDELPPPILPWASVPKWHQRRHGGRIYDSAVLESISLVRTICDSPSQTGGLSACSRRIKEPRSIILRSCCATSNQHLMNNDSHPELAYRGNLELSWLPKIILMDHYSQQDGTKHLRSK